MKLAYTRTMVRAALAGELDGARYVKDPVFGFEVPTSVPDVPPTVLSPRGTWADSAAYDAQARKLATMFRENFEQYRTQVPTSVVGAGPAE
jgi:phosphoenolpyruvate carboxykinase (ATP)